MRNLDENTKKALIEFLEADMPKDVVDDLRELSRISSQIERGMFFCKAIDGETVFRYNEIVRKRYPRCQDEEPDENGPKPAETSDFGAAIQAVKGGAKCARKGWNGKGQYIQLACNISYMTKGGKIVNAHHSAIGNNAIAFVGTSGVQIGWLASQADMLADDWYIVKEAAEE